MHNEQQIADFITEQVNAAQKISGAKLGDALRHFVPDYRLRFGTLRSIVEKFCSENVGVIPPNGPGDVYYVPASMLSSILAGAKPAETPAAFWSAFATPVSSNILCLNKESGEFKLKRTSEPDPPPPWVVIPPVTEDDYRSIASGFIGQIDSADQSVFEELVKLPSFWRPWAQKMRTFQQGKYSATWVAFRFNKLCDIYLERLKSAGINDELAAQSLGRLKTLKTAGRKMIRNTTQSSPAAALPSGLSIRRLAAVALEAMSDDELRRVWLPLGPIADAIGKCHS